MTGMSRGAAPFVHLHPGASFLLARLGFLLGALQLVLGHAVGEGLAERLSGGNHLVIRPIGDGVSVTCGRSGGPRVNPLQLLRHHAEVRDNL